MECESPGDGAFFLGPDPCIMCIMKPGRLASKEQTSIKTTISALGPQGDGLAVGDGRRVYIPGALPGEMVRATLREQMDRGVYKASLDEIITASPQRVAAPCVHYKQCGGCALQHLEMGAYRAWKVEQVRARLEKAGLHPDIWDDPVFIPEATRRRATFAVLKRGGTLLAGFHGSRSHTIVAIDRCLLLVPELTDILERSKPYLLRVLTDGQAADLLLQGVDGQIEGVLTGKIESNLAALEAFSDWTNDLNLNRLSKRRNERDEPEIVVQRQPVLARFGPLCVALPPAAFLQPGREGEAALADAVRVLLEGEKGPSADLFAGCGTFSGALLALGAVHAVEIDGPAAAALTSAGAGYNLRVEKRNLFTNPLIPRELDKFNNVLLDPPRAGASAQALQLAASRVRHIVYISCNPASFARDAAILCEGGYRLRRVRIVDQFIWSTHTELAALFTR